MSQTLKVLLLILLVSGILVTGCAEAPEIGKAAPSFQLTNIDGQSVSLSDFQGKPVLINFWATWCPPCLFEMPYIQEVYDEWSEQGLVILAINIGESPSRVENFMHSFNFSFPVLMDMKKNVTAKYNVIGYPTTYFVDSEGIIRDIRIGPFRSVAEIEDILSKISP